MHGLGNDFVVLDARNSAIAITPAVARALADRRRGIGCDQLLLLLAPQKGGDVRLRVFNPDGSEAQACGNGMRCLARYVLEHSPTPTPTLKGSSDSEHLSVEIAEECLSVVRLDERTFRVAMPCPRFEWTAIPLSRACDTGALPIAGDWQQQLSRLCAVNVGNPHAVLFFSGLRSHDFLAQARAKWGRAIEHNSLFPDRANVSFASIESPRRLRLSVWERGAGATQACGSAACALAAAGVRYESLEREITVSQEGGDLAIAWQDDAPMLMTGSADYAFYGTIDLSVAS